MNQTKRTYTTRDAAELLGVSVDHVTRLIRSRVLAASDISQPGASRPLYIIPSESIDDMLRRRNVGTRPAKRRRAELVELQDAP